jgi:hypothetical protein
MSGRAHVTRLRRAAFSFIAPLWLACGGRTEPIVEIVPRDAAVDAGRDAGPATLPCVERPDGAVAVELEFVAVHSSVDLSLALDVTGSMFDEQELLASLARPLVAELTALAPDVALGLAMTGDDANPPYGTGRESVSRDPVPVHASTDILEAALASAPADWDGGDGPEGQSQALYFLATDEPHYALMPPSCDGIAVGRMCFRSEAARIFVLFTDAPFHEGRGGTHPYDRATVPYARTHDQVIAALRETDTHVVGVFSGPPMYAGDLTQIARDTGSVTAGGSPVVVSISRDGEGIDAATVEAARTFLTEVPFDVDLHAEASARVTVAVAAERAEPSTGAMPAGDHFERVVPGTRLFFELEVRGALPAVVTLALRADRREVLERLTLRVEPGPRCLVEP